MSIAALSLESAIAVFQDYKDVHNLSHIVLPLCSAFPQACLVSDSLERPSTLLTIGQLLQSLRSLKYAYTGYLKSKKAW